MYRVFLSLGSNIGERLENLSRAVDELRAIASIRAISSIYETEPIEMWSETAFLNMAVEVETPSDAPLLLAQLKKIEKKLGRKLPSHGEPRIIDIDILMYRGIAYEDHSVCVPHSQLEHRRFALEPLCEIAPTALHPTLEKTMATLLRKCSDTHKVTRTEYHINYSIIN
jgi:2-amino-4-hydroxy-6-hydroxymethyldihydropteridine diphosphokinase